MRSYLSLSIFALSIAATAVACSGSSGGSGDDDTSSSGSVASSSSGGTSGASSSSSGNTTSSSGGTSTSSSGQPVQPGKPGAACEGVADCDDKVCVEHTCREGTSTDGTKNGNETGVDCGGSGTGTDTHAPGCATDGACTVPADCVNAVCTAGKCIAPTSSDTVQNGNETGVDCGSSAVGQDTSAPKCADTLTCGVPTDCASGVCTTGVCQVPTSLDHVKNGNETDEDCGSSVTGDGVVDTGAPACGTQKACGGDPDCESLICADNMCQAASCIDSKKNGHETSINCGGDECAPCGDTLACILPRDCQSTVCTGGFCIPPNNHDNAKNGKETDVDCGKSTPLGVDTTAPTCKDTLLCIADGDCHSGKCVNNHCAVPTKTDSVKNGNETDVDCGTGPIVVDPVYGTTVNTGAGKCGTDASCLAATDCSQGVCTALKCKAPAFNDTVKNGNETDLDCGGDAFTVGAPSARGAGTTAQNNRCIADKTCIVDEDCKSDACSGGKCLLARSCAMHHGGDTCGTGDETWAASDVEPALYSIKKKHESCCVSIPVTTGAGTVMMDKYPITAGRMRRFIETLANFPVTANLDAANVKAWVDAAAPLNASNQRLQAAASVMDVSQLPVANEDKYPTSWNTPVAAASDCGQNGNLPCNYGWAAHLGGFRYNLEPGGAGGYGCQIDDGAHGSRTFYLPDAPAPGAANRYRDFNGEEQHPGQQRASRPEAARLREPDHAHRVLRVGRRPHRNQGGAPGGIRNGYVPVVGRDAEHGSGLGRRHQAARLHLPELGAGHRARLGRRERHRHQPDSLPPCQLVLGLLERDHQRSLVLRRRSRSIDPERVRVHERHGSRQGRIRARGAAGSLSVGRGPTRTP